MAYAVTEIDDKAYAPQKKASIKQHVLKINILKSAC